MPVPLTADRPRFGLLSPFHRAGDVEKCALGALRAHWAEGTRKDSTASDVAECRLGRNIRELGIAAIVMCVGGVANGNAQPSRDAWLMRGFP
jgi:hypothetical protein